MTKDIILLHWSHYASRLSENTHSPKILQISGMSIFASVIIDEINGVNKITKRLYKYGLYCVTELCRREERKKCRYIHKERLCVIGRIHHPHDLWHIDEKTPRFLSI